MPTETAYIGDAPDLRTNVEKLRDYRPEELYAASPVDWREKKAPGKGKFQYKLTKAGKWRKFPTRDQDGSSTCVGQTHSKLLGIENFNEEGVFTVFSARPLYRWRANRPGSGMAMHDAFSLGSKRGTSTEARIPSQRLDDYVIDADLLPWDAADESIAKKYRGGGYVCVYDRDRDAFDIEKLAAAIQTTRAGLALHIFATGKEWKQSTPQIIVPGLTYQEATVRHCITGVDFILWKGEKAIVIDESWGNDTGMDGQRILTESFLRLRLRYAGHYLPLSNTVAQGDKPSAATLYRAIKWLDSGSDVVALQNILKYEGCFPSNTPSTGLFWSATAAGVKKWQLIHSIADFADETDPRKIVFGSKSLALARSLYP